MIKIKFPDDSIHNCINVKHVEECIHAELNLKNDISDFHGEIRTKMELLKLPETERYSESSISLSDSYPDQSSLSLGDAGLTEKDFEGFSEEEQEMFAPYNDAYSDISDSELSADEDSINEKILELKNHSI